MKINSLDKNIKALLTSNYYNIPRFQRPYSWDRENVSEFWNDAIADSDGDYFIGSMVVFKSNGDLYGVVDGQQRLTTIMMILCALRNALDKDNFSDLATGIHSLIERNNIDNKSQYILSTETSYPYFQEYIQKRGKPSIDITAGEEEKNIENAFAMMNTYINEAIDSVRKDPTLNKEKKQEKIKEKLLMVRDKILNLKLIFIELDSEDDAYVIFETLNTRGKDLSVSDLVKNHLAKYIKPKNVTVDTHKIQWERILSTIDGSAADLEMDNYLHHYWLSKYDFVTLKKLFKQVRKRVVKNNAQDFLDEVEKDSITYREIHETNYRKWAVEELVLKKSLDALSVFRVKQQIPMVLSLMRDYKSKQIKLKHVQDTLLAIENFHFIFTAVTSQRSSGGISLMYASAAKKLDGARSISEELKVLKDFKSKVRKKIPTYKEFEVNFSEIVFTNELTKNKKLVQYILSKIDGHLQKTYTVDYDNMTIEHIAPQDQKGSKKLKSKTIGQLGNLLFLNKELNEKLKSKNFTEKRKILQDNSVVLDKKIKDVKAWGEKEIQERTKYFAKLAYEKIWSI